MKRRKGSRSLSDYKDDVYLCARCGYCRDMIRARDKTAQVCPIRENTGGFESYTARGRNIIARGILEGKVVPSSLSTEFIDSLYACTLCGSCQEHCLALDERSWSRFPDNKFSDHKIDILGINEAMRSAIVEKGVPPGTIRQVLRNLSLHGNAEGLPRSQRDAYAEQFGFPVKRAKDERCKTLLYPGSVASYSERSQRTIRAIAVILRGAETDFCILGSEEEDSGADALRLGETGLFEELAQRNIQLLKKYGIKQIICLSPHDFDTFQNDYPVFLGEQWTELKIKVQHYAETLLNLLRNNKIHPERRFSKMVTYQDPCYLGRINGLYNAPREILRRVTDLAEMKLTRHNSFCCGGGGGGLWHDPLDKPRLETERAKQACATGAEIVAVACPTCAKMLETGLSSIPQCKMQVMDIAEILLETMSFINEPASL
ncbi:MAG: (Fe-S)-binding protein [Candidatus Bathyarchaeota archaeon]|nr:MAG: (Fe-S)-binding protein [Candidatus Bathyarchaeota archaeon]